MIKEVWPFENLQQMELEEAFSCCPPQLSGQQNQLLVKFRLKRLKSGYCWLDLVLISHRCRLNWKYHTAGLTKLIKEPQVDGCSQREYVGQTILFC